MIITLIKKKQNYFESLSSLSESGFKRLSVTRNFVERHANAEEIYGKSPMTSRKGSLETSPRREQIEVQAMVGSRRSSLKKGQRVTEDELCEEIVRKIHNSHISTMITSIYVLDIELLSARTFVGLENCNNETVLEI